MFAYYLTDLRRFHLRTAEDTNFKIIRVNYQIRIYIYIYISYPVNVVSDSEENSVFLVSVV